jgi:hypothetical protein
MQSSPNLIPDMRPVLNSHGDFRMSARRQIFEDEWKEHIRQASLQRIIIGIGPLILVGALIYLSRPWQEIIIAIFLATICGFLSEISIDVKGMRLMMAEEREGAIQANKERERECESAREMAALKAEAGFFRPTAQ